LILNKKPVGRIQKIIHHSIKPIYSGSLKQRYRNLYILKVYLEVVRTPSNIVDVGELLVVFSSRQLQKKWWSSYATDWQ